MKAIEDMNYEELQNAVLFEDDMSLYEMFEEKKFLDKGYTEDELRTTILTWITSCPDTVI